MKYSMHRNVPFFLVLAFSLLFFWGCADAGPREFPPERSGGASRSGSAGKITYIDVHAHPMGNIRSAGGMPEEDFQGAARAALAAMDRMGIAKTILMPFPFFPNLPGIFDIDELVSRVGTQSGRFAFLGGGGTLNIMVLQAFREGKTDAELRSRFEEKALQILSKGAVGFGEMMAEHVSLGPDHPYGAVPPDHPLLLLLADIAARYDVPIDLHMEAVPEEMPLPEGLRSPPNPASLHANIPAFERLLSHNPKAKIIWAHAGWDQTGRRTTALMADLLQRHSNLYMSIKIGRDSRPENRPMNSPGEIRPEWLALIRAFPDRFLIGSDQFYLSPRAAQRFPQRTEVVNEFLSVLPAELARKVGYENPVRLFKLEK